MTTLDKHGNELQPGDIVRWRGGDFKILSIWILSRDKTNLTLYAGKRDPMMRAKSSEVTLCQPD